MSPHCHSCDEFSQTLSVSCCFSASNPNSTSVYHSQHTLKNKRRGRPGNVTPWTVPPRKWSPRTAHGRIIGPPGPNIAAILGPPLLPTVPPAADCSLFAIASATALAYGEQPGRCLLDQNKVRQHLLKSAGGEDDTTIEEESA